MGGAIGGGRGAGIGAASGAIGGAGLGAVGSSNAQRSIQAQYDNAFAACMFSLGNTMPGMKPMMTQPQGAAPATAQMTGWLWRKNLGDPLADQPSRLLCRNGPVAAATAGKEVVLLSLTQTGPSPGDAERSGRCGHPAEEACPKEVGFSAVVVSFEANLRPQRRIAIHSLG